MGLGPVHTVGLSKARDEARKARQLVRDGRDPITVRRAAASTAPTFRSCAEGYAKAHAIGWTPKHAAQWLSSLEDHVFPTLGDLPVDRIDLDAVLSVLRPIWEARTVTASRVRTRIEKALDFAKVKGHRSGENPARWRGHLDSLLAMPKKKSAVSHLAAIHYRDAHALTVKIRETTGFAARCLELILLTAVRSGEARGATWREIDLDARTWTIPAERTKARAEHVVPLSDQAIELLRGLPRLDGTDLLFPAPSGKPMRSDDPVNVLRDCGGGETTVHGLRTTFRTWGTDLTTYPRELLEMCLAHKVGSAVEQAYNRTDGREKRRRLMADWATFLDRAPAAAGEVVPIRREA